jgi:hypothetical protein
MKGTQVGATLVALVCMNALLGCNEKPEFHPESRLATASYYRSHYATAAEATRDQAFERGWLPAVLLPDATDIQQWHDIEENLGEGQFALNESLLHRIQVDCLPTQNQTSWWDKRTGQVNVVRCGEFYIATNPSKRIGYFRVGNR